MSILRNMHISRFFILPLILFAAFGEAEAQKSNLDSLLRVLKTQLADSNRVNTLNDITKAYTRVDPNKAILYSDSALTLANELDFADGKSRALTLKGEAYYTLGKYDEMIPLAHEVIKLQKDRNNSSAYRLLGNAYYSKADYTNSLNAYLESLTESEKFNDSVGIGSAYTGIGNVYFQMGNYQKAKDSHEKSLVIFERRGDKLRASKAYNNIGNTYLYLKMYDEADSCYQRSYDLKEELGDIKGMAMTLNNQSEVALKFKHDTARAIDFAFRALELRQSVSDHNGIAMSYHNLGYIYYYTQDYGLAEKYSLLGLQEASSIGDRFQVKDSYRLLGMIAAGQNEFSKAYDYQEQYIALNDSLLGEENSRQINEMSAKYESEKKDKELLKKDAEAKQNSIIRNAFIGAFILMLLLALFIFRGYQQKQKSNIEITHQKEIIEEKNKEITDSIHYAQRIQRALLASGDLLKSQLPEHFVLYLPKDIVSGDFYWASANAGFYITAADCTGHGVPGAFMSLLSISALNETLAEKRNISPDAILNRVRESLIASLHADGDSSTKDGMDCVLCKFDFLNKKLQFACANNPLWIIRNHELIEFKGDKMPVGQLTGNEKPFSLLETELQSGDIIYLFTDGFADQFGGPKGKKFRYSQLKESLLEYSTLTMETQRENLVQRFNAWKGNMEQVDDVLIIGIRIS